MAVEQNIHSASRPLHAGAQGQLLWRGPRVKMGMYEGSPTAVVPHPASGRADYFGILCNRCVS